MLTIDDQPCPFGCTYCFRDFSQYRAPLTLLDVEADSRLLERVEVVYPACDVDLFARSDAIDVLQRVAKLGVSISVSTKASLSARRVDEVRPIAEALATKGALLKISVSITTKHAVSKFEPRVPSYEARVQTLRNLARAGIASALVMRPLLVDVPRGEYQEILKEAGPITGAALIGDEWLDANEDKRRLGDAPSKESVRRVGWMDGNPMWPVRRSPDTVLALRAAARESNVALFESDLELMRHLTATRT